MTSILSFFRNNGIILFLLAAFTIMTSYVQTSHNTLYFYSTVNEGKLPQQIKGIPMNKDFQFAGESLPMNNFDVRERLERELIINSYHHSNTILALKYMQRYFPVIDRILTEEGLPLDLRYIAVAESGLMAGSVSPAGAKGIWQIMKATGQQYNLEITGEVDERYHLEKATRAACQHLRMLHDQFNGSWIHAAAAYNMGAAGLRKELTDQKADNYWELNTNSETMRYVFRIVAIKEIMEHPQLFGYDITPEESYVALDNAVPVEVSTAIPSLGDFAKSHGASFRMLKVYNPWLLNESLMNPAHKTYAILLPGS
jgi:hypothetical protein